MTTYESARIEAPRQSRLLKALKSPGLVLEALNAQRLLRSCETVPSTTRVRGRIFVDNHGGRIALGDHVRFSARTVPIEMVAWHGAEISIGARSFINYGVSLSAEHKLTIGEDCLIGSYVNIMDSDYHDVGDHMQHGKVAAVEIGDNVWIGTRAMVLKGVRIGNGSVIGAGSVVTKDVPPHVLVCGVPAQVVRQL